MLITFDDSSLRRKVMLVISIKICIYKYLKNREKYQRMEKELFVHNFYILIREGIRFMQNVTPPCLSNVHVLRPPESEKMVFTNVSVCLLCVDF